MESGQFYANGDNDASKDDGLEQMETSGVASSDGAAVLLRAMEKGQSSGGRNDNASGDEGRAGTMISGVVSGDGAEVRLRKMENGQSSGDGTDKATGGGSHKETETSRVASGDGIEVLLRTVENGRSFEERKDDRFSGEEAREKRDNSCVASGDSAEVLPREVGHRENSGDGNCKSPRQRRREETKNSDVASDDSGAALRRRVVRSTSSEKDGEGFLFELNDGQRSMDDASVRLTGRRLLTDASLRRRFISGVGSDHSLEPYDAIGIGYSSGSSESERGYVSGASERICRSHQHTKTARREALDPAERPLHDVRTAWGFTRLSDRVVEEVHCKIVTGGTGLPLASLVDWAVEEALGGGAGPPKAFLDAGRSKRLFRGVWETTFSMVVVSILFVLWAYEGSSPSVTDMITVVVSAAGSLGIVSRAFSAREYLGVVYSGHVGSGVVGLRPVSAEMLDEAFRLFGVCGPKGLGQNVGDFIRLVIAVPALVGFALCSAVTIVRYIVFLVIGSENNGSWELGTGVLRYQGRVMVVPFMEKKPFGVDRGMHRARMIEWPGGAVRAYFGGAVLGPWALHFSSRSSFLLDLSFDRLFIQFGVERRLIVEVGTRTLSFVIAMRDKRGGLLLIPVEDSAGVRVRISIPAFSGATGGVTIFMKVEYPKRATSPEEKVGRILKLIDKPFCLDVSACGIGKFDATETGLFSVIGKNGRTKTALFDVLDGAGAGVVTDECPLWKSLPSMRSFDSPAASWAAGYFGGNFRWLHEYRLGGDIERHEGVGTGVRCVTLTPGSDELRLIDFDVVLGVRSCGRGIQQVPVNQPEDVRTNSQAFRCYQNVQEEGIKGRYCLIPGGKKAEWHCDTKWKRFHRRDGEECLVGAT